MTGSIDRTGCLSQTQADRLERVQAAVERGMSQGDAAVRCGLSGAALSSFLGYVLGSYGYPPPPALLARALALDVLADAEVRRRAALKGNPGRKATARAKGKYSRREGVPVVDETEAAIEQRLAANAAQHRAREARWLDEEQTKYGLPTRGIPLSEMPA